MPNLLGRLNELKIQDKTTLWIPHLINPQIAYTKNHRHHEHLRTLKSKEYQIIGYAGSINKSTALNYFLDAAVELIDQNIAFVILGDGPLLNQFKKDYASRNIIFLSKVPQNEVVSFLKDCDILFDGYTKSKVYRFGNSRNKYVEYCLASRPILVSYSGFKLFIENENCGIVVEPESVKSICDGINSLLNLSNNELDQMGKNAFIFANKFMNVDQNVLKLTKAINVLKNN